MIVSCLNCGKTPAQLEEYRLMAEEEGITPEALVKAEEGTYNAISGKFWCTPCYCDLGMPLGMAQ